MTDLLLLVESLPLLEAETAGPSALDAYLSRVLRTAGDRLAKLARRAIRRLLAHGHTALGDQRLFTDDEIAQLTELYGSANATANLLGRAGVRDLQREVEYERGEHQERRASYGSLGGEIEGGTGSYGPRTRNRNTASVIQEHAILDRPILEGSTVPVRTQQRWYSCGAAVLRAVLAGYGLDVSEEKLDGQLGTNERKGTPPEDLIRVAKAYGCQVIQGKHWDRATLEALTQSMPVICAVNMYGGGHYVAVDGVKDGKVYFMDPASGAGRRHLTWQQFLNDWHSTDWQGKRYTRHGIAIAKPNVKEGANAQGNSGQDRFHYERGFAVRNYLGCEAQPEPTRDLRRDGRDPSYWSQKVKSGRLEEELSAPERLLSPEAAVNYFLGLLPMLGIDPQRFGLDMRRRAFTLAWATDDTLLSTVKDIITSVLETGQQVSTAPQMIRDVFERAGVMVGNPQYAEMVLRTNLLDSFNQGHWEELQDPEVSETFPAWQYLAIVDSRSRPEHAARDGKYYPVSVPFAAVRGTRAEDVCNCRCSFRAVDKWDWAELVAKGARLES